jgi:hypothetical protein
MKRIGPKMRIAAEYVAEHPGCAKFPAATACAPHTSVRLGYLTVDRAIRAGLISATLGTSRYYLNITPNGLAVL